MAKTVPPGIISVPGVGRFVANAVPDPFDERDLEYRPRLEPLLPTLDQRSGQIVLFQKGNSCTGHAVATAINTVLARSVSDAGGAALNSAIDPAPAKRVSSNGASSNGVPRVRRASPATTFPRVSPYMLYRLARRYDEFEGEEDAGSSLRGAFKGWFNHGVALQDEWPDLEMEVEPDLDDFAFQQRCRERPLGAFYRVNPYRLDDMQSALNELQVIVVSAIIHDGWIKPVVMQQGREKMHVLARRVNSQSLGGHAFALVGYNEVGFLVQNSWGAKWGKGGFATLPYEDWLDLAYDAWVARPGVPKTPFSSGRNRAAIATSGTLATAPGPDLQRLAVHVVNLGNNGQLSANGKFVSTPGQIDRLFQHMSIWHDWWVKDQPGSKRHVVLYAHGGLVSEADGLANAQKHLNWWLNNRVYPLSFAWQSGPAETIIDQLADLTRGRLPFGGVGFDLVEQVDRLVEKIVRSSLRWMWDEMKENARAASQKITGTSPIQWPPNAATEPAMRAMPGASLTVTRLAKYIQQHGAGNVAVHLVGHSAGSIFHAGLLQRLKEARIAVDSMTLLAPAVRVDEWTRDVLPHLQSNARGNATVARFSTFAMSDRRELDDTVGTNNITPYHKSLLYLVSRAFERAVEGQGGEVPLLGMGKFFDRPLSTSSRTTLRQAIAALSGSRVIFSRSDAPDDARCDAIAHGDFDDDAPTMTSVVMRALNVQDATRVKGYQSNAALNPEVCPPAEHFKLPAIERTAASSMRASSRSSTEGGTPTGSLPRSYSVAGAGPLKMASATHAPGQEPVVETAEPQTEQPVAPQSVPGTPSPEVAVAPRSGSSVIDLLECTGWHVQDSENATQNAIPAQSAKPDDESKARKTTKSTKSAHKRRTPRKGKG